MDDVCWFMSMYYVRTHFGDAWFLFWWSSHLTYSTNIQMVLNAWIFEVKSWRKQNGLRNGLTPTWEMVGIYGNIYAGTAKNLTLKRQFTRHSKRIIACEAIHRGRLPTSGWEWTMKASTMRSLCCNMAKSRKGSGGGDRMDMEIADILLLTASCRVGLCLNFSSNMNMPETEAPFCDPHWCRCHQFHPQFLCCAVCRGQWHSTEWWHA